MQSCDYGPAVANWSYIHRGGPMVWKAQRSTTMAVLLALRTLGNRIGMPLHVGNDRQSDREFGAKVDLAFYANRTVVFVDDAIRDR